MYNNYNYSPYNRYMQQPIQQPIQQPQQVIPVQQNSLNGKIISDIETAKILEYPLDGSVSYYPIADNSAIVTKQLQMDGKTKIMIYKPIEEPKENVPKYLTKDDLEDVLDELGINDLDDLKDEIKNLKSELKELKSKKKSDDK